MDQQLLADRLNMLTKNAEIEFVFDGEDTVLRVRTPVFTLNLTISDDQLGQARSNITKSMDNWFHTMNGMVRS